MKFSTIFSVAFMVSSAFALPQAATAETNVVAKRASALSTLKTELTSAISQAQTVVNQVTTATKSGDATKWIPTLTTELLSLNSTISEVTGLLGQVGLGSATAITSPFSILTGFGSSFTSIGSVLTLLGKLVTTLTTLISKLLNATLFSGELASLKTAVTSGTLPSLDSLTPFATAVLSIIKGLSGLSGFSV